MSTSLLKRTKFFKIISLCLALTFSFYNISFATQDDVAKVPAEKIVDSNLNVNNIGIAIDCGTIKSKHQGKNDKIIIHIQDAHCNYEAQQNINRMLDQLVKECGVGLISVEGAEGIVDTSWFKAFPDAGIREEVANYFMKKGEITGAELFSIISDYKGTIFGAENRDDYIANLKAFTKTYPYKSVIENFFLDTSTIANRLKTIIYPPKLKELDLKIRGFEDKEIELSDFAAFLNSSLKKQDISIKTYPNFEKLVNTLEYEEKIDFDTVDQERSQYIDLLGKKMSKEEMTKLVTKSISFKKGHIKAVDFYSYLRDLAKIHDIDMYKEFPSLFYYYIYTKLYDGIDNEGLFKEIDQIQTELKERLFTDDAQRTLDKYSRMIDMYVDLVNIELTNDDYDLFKQYNSESTLDGIIGFLGRLCDRYGLSYSIDTVPVQISENMPNMVEFYEIAMKRDNTLIDNTLRQMDEENQTVSVLITGGFHTRGIKDVLEEKGVSYVVVMPKITKDVESPYIQVLTNQRTALEDIFTESAIPATAANMSMSNKEVAQPEGEVLSPILKFGMGIAWLIDEAKRPWLTEWSERIGRPEMEEAATVKQAVEEMFEEMGTMLTRLWLEKIQAQLIETYEEEEGKRKWAEFLQDDVRWDMLRTVYLSKYEEEGGVSLEDHPAVKALIIEKFDEFRKEASTPGEHAAGTVLTEEQAKEFDVIIRKSFRLNKHKIEPRSDVNRYRRGLPEFAFVTHEDLVKKLDEAGIPVNVHPGRGGAANQHRLYQAHIDKYIYEKLSGDERKELAEHEIAHLDIFNAEELAQRMRAENRNVAEVDIMRAIRDQFGDKALLTWERWNNYAKSPRPLGDDQEEFVKKELGYDLMEGRLAEKIAELIEEKRELIRQEEEEARHRVEENILRNSDNMAKAAAENKGPDVIIVVSSTNVQADFWQNRLTDRSNIKGSGAIVKKDAVVLSVSESNWKGAAGNGLGTLNGFVQAARKAMDLGLLRDLRTKYGLPARSEDATLMQLVNAFTEYCSGKSTFMYHTAGKGTRTAPLPGAEVNSKPNIKLPTMVGVNGELEPVTVLESVIMQTSIYAESREDRLSVFWGDQVIVNEKDIKCSNTHHVEIFGMLVPLDESIEAYGVLIPGQRGDCSQREKLSLEEVRMLLPEATEDVYRSIGSFTITLEFFIAMMTMREHMEALEKGEGKLDTDPDWWQALTSTRSEYIAAQGKKNIPSAVAGAQWDRMNRLWEDFGKRGMGKIGYTDVGKDSLWWDYGQNKYFLQNMQTLTEDSMRGQAARKFFNVDEDNWVNEDSNIESGESNIERSVIKNSTIKNVKKLKNCVVIDSTLGEVEAENSVIIGNTVIKLNAVGALSYNVVQKIVNLREGQLLANVFHPELGKVTMRGRIPMRTHVSRDGRSDWDNEVFVYDNMYTYSDISKHMEEGVTSDISKATRKALAEELLEKGEIPELSPSELVEVLTEQRERKASELEQKARDLEEAGKRKEAREVRTQANRARIIPVSVKAAEEGLGSMELIRARAKARRVIAIRMVEFGDIEEFTPAGYIATFPNVTEEMALEELKTVNAMLKVRKIFPEEAEKAKSEPERLEFALVSIEEWLTEERFSEYREALLELIDLAETDEKVAKELYDSFWRVIPFGTGGRRWRIGIGPNRMNAYMAAMTAQGHVMYLKENYPEQLAAGNAVIGTWDVRAFYAFHEENDAYLEVLKRCDILYGLSSEKLSKIVGLVYAGNGIKYIHPVDMRPTPWLSFIVNKYKDINPTVRFSGEMGLALDAIESVVAGIVLSSSHNPFDNNGTKFYEDSGAQAPPQIVQQLMDLGDSVTQINYAEAELYRREGLEEAYNEAVRKKQIITLDKDNMKVIDEVYFRTVVEEVKSVYTPDEWEEIEPWFNRLIVSFNALNGTGATTLMPILEALKFQVRRSEGDKPSWDFSEAFNYIPNPELEKSFNAAMQIGIRRTLEWVFSKKVTTVDTLIDEDGVEITMEELVEENGGRGFTSTDELLHHIQHSRNKVIRGLILNVDTENKEEVQAFNAINNICLMTDPDADRIGLGMILPLEEKDGKMRLQWVSANDNDEAGIMLIRYRLERFLEMAKQGELIKYIEDRLPEERKRADHRYQLIISNTVVSNPLEVVIAERLSEEIMAATNGRVEVRTVTHHVGFKFAGEIIDIINRGEYEPGSLPSELMMRAGIDLKRAFFVLATEEGEGSLIGFSGSIDKDSGVTGLSLAVLAAEQLKKGQNLYHYLQETYDKYGYSKTYLEPMVMRGNYGFNMINQKIMPYLRDTVLTNIKQGRPVELSMGNKRYTFTRGNDHYDLAKAYYGVNPEEWPQAIREALNIIELEAELLDGTRIIVVARPSGTEPKQKNVVTVIGPKGMARERVDEINREVMDVIMMACYESSGAEFRSDVEERPGSYRIADLSDNDKEELLKILPITVACELKLGVYFPLRNYIRDEAIRIDALPSEQEENEEFAKIRQKVEGYLDRFQAEGKGIGLVEEAVRLNLLRQIRTGEIDEIVKWQAYLWFGKEIGENVYNNLRDTADEMGALQARDVTPGIYSARSTPQEGTPLANIVESVEKGTPFYLRAFEAAKVWGREVARLAQRIGEYWYGDGLHGENVSDASVNENKAPMNQVMEYAAEDVVGKEAMHHFGAFLPLVKILTPAERLSVQFHAEKNELWIISGIDKSIAGEKPMLIMGFSQASIDRYGEGVKAEYRKALVEYGELLNQLIDLMEEREYQRELTEAENVIAAAQQVAFGDSEVASLLGRVVEAQQRLDSFYNYVEVEVGDVIPIPVGTLHALGAGIEVVEPQIAGPTQGLEDGARYPVRYYFPGHEREGAKKMLDVERVGELRAEVWEKVAPEVIEKTDSFTIERLPGEFEHKGLEVHRITMEKESQMEVSEVTSAHTLTVVTGEARVLIDGKPYGITRAVPGEKMLVIPATVKSYTIVTTEGAEIIDTFTPIPETRPIPAPFVEDEAIAGTGEFAGKVTGVYNEFPARSELTEELEIIGTVKAPQIIGERPHMLTIQKGAVSVILPDGRELAYPDEKPVVFGKGEILTVTREGIKTRDGREFAFAQAELTVEYQLKKASEEKAVVKVDYDKDAEERAVYGVYEVLSKHIPAIAGNPVDLILPEQMFVPGEDVGSRKWEEDQLNKYIEAWYSMEGRTGEYQKLLKNLEIDGLVRIVTYKATSKDVDPASGLLSAAKVKIRNGATAVLGATTANINYWTDPEREESNEKTRIRNFVTQKNVRVMALPDIVDKIKDNEGWFLAREVEGTGILQAALTAGDISEERGLARDMQRLMSQLTGRAVAITDLYYMLSYSDDNIPATLRPENPFAWMIQLVQRLLLNMPVKPFDPTEQLEQRRKVMYSV